MELQEYRYPTSALMRDYLRAVTGLTVFGGPALFVPLSSVMFALLGGLGLLFAAFALRTFLRQQSRLLADDRGLRFAGFHFPGSGFGRIERAGTGYIFIEEAS